MKTDADYFMLAHNTTALAVRRQKRKLFVASFKHALLFTEQLVLADHMIVNSPNFRSAFHEDRSFREIALSGLMSVVHFDGYIDGPHFTLSETRRFLVQAGSGGPSLFHGDVPEHFRTAEFDDERALIQEAVEQICPEDASSRDGGPRAPNGDRCSYRTSLPARGSCATVALADLGGGPCVGVWLSCCSPGRARVPTWPWLHPARW